MWSLKRVWDESSEWQGGMQGKGCLPLSHTFEYKSEMTLWLEHRWVRAEVCTHMQLRSKCWHCIISSPGPSVWCESHPKSACQCHSGDPVSHKSHQPVGAIQLSGCPPRPGPSPQRTLWAQILGFLKAIGQPYTWSKGWESAPRGRKQGLAHTCPCLKTGAVICAQPLGLLWLNEPYWKEIR